MTSPDGHADVDSYVAQELSAAERGVVQEHLQLCERCREEEATLSTLRTALQAVPAEALLRGPPADADLLLQRTLRQVRAEATRELARRRAAVAAVAVVLAAAMLGTGVLVGRQGLGGQSRGQGTAVAPTVGPAVPGTRLASARDAQTGARLTAAIAPFAGWVRLHVSVSGIPAGEPCRLVVLGRDGQRVTAGGWLVSAKTAEQGVDLDGSALLPPDQVAGLVVETTSGKQYVSVAL